MKILILISTLLLAPASWAQNSFFQGTEVIAGTEMPYQIGAKLKVQLPSHIHMTAGLGYIPEFYSETFASVAGSAGIMGENTAEMAMLGMAGAIVVDIRAAYSLDPDGGLYAEAGYNYITGGSGSTTGDVAEAAYDVQYSGFDAADSLSVEGSIHALTLHIGYMYLLTERLSLNIDIGLVKPVMADLDVSSSGVTAAVKSQIDSDIKGYLEDVYVSEMFIPTGSLWLSFLF